MRIPLPSSSHCAVLTAETEQEEGSADTWSPGVPTASAREAKYAANDGEPFSGLSLMTDPRMTRAERYAVSMPTPDRRTVFSIAGIATIASLSVFTLATPALAQTPAPTPEAPAAVVAPVAPATPAPAAAPPAAPSPPGVLRDSLLTAPPSVAEFKSGRKIQLGGFVYSRFDQVTSGARTGSPSFPEGSGTPNGYNGNGDNGFNNSTFKIRESRIFALATFSPKAKAIAEIAPSGSLNTTAAGATPINTRRIYGQYTLGDGSPRNLSILAGQLWQPFGFSPSNPLPFWYAPERPLLGKESARGLFDGQEFDRGVKLEIAPGTFYAAIAVLNGTGLTSNDTNRGRDLVLRVRKTEPKLGFSYGASFYNGSFSASQTQGTGQTAVTTIRGDAKRSFFGLDAQYNSPKGPFLQAEFVGGKYEAIAPATLGDPRAATPTFPSPFLSGNKIEGYSAIFGWTFGPRSAHPWSVIGMYDVLNRSKSSSTQTDANWGGGASYNLGVGVKARLFYTKPFKVSYTGAVKPRNVGLVTADVLFVF